MNTSIKNSGMWIAAMLAVAAGIAFTLQAVRMRSAVSERIVKRAEAMQRLQEIAGDVRRAEQAVELYGKLAQKKTGSPTDALKTVFPDQKIEDPRETRREISGGWALKQKEYVLDDVSIGKAMEFVQKAEAMRPPWIMTRCAIRSSTTAAGAGHVAITLEALEK